jgi:hypothetical protein
MFTGIPSKKAKRTYVLKSFFSLIINKLSSSLKNKFGMKIRTAVRLQRQTGNAPLLH